jgi:crotonobetainyl-CoA:carnitine CoA-transferase CaiB-like acyl-CoA transferase
MGVLDDTTVVDFTQLMAGGWTTQKLGDMGADVIKIERPGGDVQRQMGYQGKFIDGEGIGFLAMNRNKRSVAVDLKTDEGHEVARRLVEEADVMVQNYRPGVMERLGFDYETVAELNPEIVYVSVSAYGSDGPYAERPGQDLLYQAATGLASYTGRAGEPPTPAGTVVVDEHTATLAALRTMEALYHRLKTGEGQKVEMSLFDAAIDMQVNEITFTVNTDSHLDRGEKTHGHPYLSAPYGIFEAADGYVAIGYSPLPQVADALGLDELHEYDDADQPTLFEARDHVHDVIEAHTSEVPCEELVDTLVEADVQAATVEPPEAVPDHPQAQHNGMIVDVDHPRGGSFETTGIPGRLSETDGEIRRRPPALAEHTDEVLAELGYSDEEIGDLRERGAVE